MEVGIGIASGMAEAGDREHPMQMQMQMQNAILQIQIFRDTF
jgi:hypothetical protein